MKIIIMRLCSFIPKDISKNTLARSDIKLGVSLLLIYMAITSRVGCRLILSSIFQFFIGSYVSSFKHLDSYKNTSIHSKYKDNNVVPFSYKKYIGNLNSISIIFLPNIIPSYQEEIVAVCSQMAKIYSTGTFWKNRIQVTLYSNEYDSYGFSSNDLQNPIIINSL
ncbi:hypothetical protein [Aquimarina gracilis]|uniref:hypothetical protein n=1 Tax=Aquimarina gracilis TaxID=874422 RepID=UPI002B471914|nr:hypothetical protein [Aquimarina gracilis]